jgi:hypothetical protein
MAKSIGQICDKSVKLANESILVHADISDYCDAIAQKYLGNPEFSFSTLPDPIVEILFYGGVKPEGGWSSFIKKEVIEELKRMSVFG